MAAKAGNMHFERHRITFNFWRIFR